MTSFSSHDYTLSHSCLATESPVLPSHTEAKMNYFQSDENFGMCVDVVRDVQFWQ